MTIKEFYNTFFQRDKVLFLYDLVKKYKLESMHSEDLYLINKWYNEFTISSKFNIENKSNYAQSVNSNQLDQDINESLFIYEEFKKIAEFVKNFEIKHTNGSLFSPNKIEMATKNLKNTYPNWSPMFSLAHNLAQ